MSRLNRMENKSVVAGRAVKIGWRLTAFFIAAALLSVSAAKTQLPAGKVVFLKENRLYIDWNRSSGVKKGNLVTVFSGKETLGTATIGWVLDDLTMAEMATGFSRLAGIPLENLSVATEVEKPIVRATGFAVGMANPLETGWTKRIPTPDNLALLACLYEGLVAKTEEGRFAPLLCDSFRASEKLITFYLKPRLSFSSGRRLTAFEVKKVFDTLMRVPGAARWASLLAPKAAWPKRFPPLTSPVEVKDTTTFTFHLKDYTPLFLSYLASPLGWISDFSDTLSRFPAGTGPYRVEAIRPNSLRLLKNRVYHGQGAQADTLIFRWFAQREDAEAALTRGEISLACFKAGELSQGLRNDPAFRGQNGFCRLPASKTVFAFFVRPVSADSSRMLASGAAYTAGDIGTELFRGDWLVLSSNFGRPDSFRINFQVESQLDSTGLISAYLSTSRSDLPLFEMQMAQVEAHVDDREVRLSTVLGKLKDYTGSRLIDSLTSVLNQALYSAPKEKEALLSRIEKSLADHFALIYLYRPAMTVLARSELSGFRCGSPPYYPAIFKKGNRKEAVSTPADSVTDQP